MVKNQVELEDDLHAKDVLEIETCRRERQRRLASEGVRAVRLGGRDGIRVRDLEGSNCGFEVVRQ